MTVYRKGDAIEVVHEGRTVEGNVIFASPNGLSLMIGFDAMLGGHVGMMPVTMRDATTGNSVVDGTEVTIRKRAQ
jgi:hypothetical protein